MNTGKRILIVILFIAALLVGAVAVWFGLNLGKDSGESGDDVTATTLTCTQGMFDEFAVDGEVDSVIWSNNTIGDNTASIENSRLKLDIPLQTGPQSALLVTNNSMEGEFSASLEIYELSSENGNGKVSISFTDSSLLELGAYLDTSANEIVIEGSVFGGDAIQDARIPVNPSIDGQPIVTLKLDRLLRTTATGTEEADIKMYYNNGDGFELLGTTQGAEIFAEEGIFKISGSIPNFEDTSLSTVVDNFTVACPIDTEEDDNTAQDPSGGLFPTIEPTLTFGSEDVDIPNITGAPTPTPDFGTGDETPTVIPTVVPTEITDPGDDDGAITIAETATTTCNVDATTTYSITISNSQNIDRVVNIFDTLSTSVLDTYVQTSTISQGGTFLAGQISWLNITIPANSNMTLTYKLLIPESAFGTYTDSVRVEEISKNNAQVATSTYSYEISCLPGTAIINNQADRLIFAFILIIVGYLIYSTGLYIQTGQIFWNKLGKRILPNLTVGFEEQLKDDFEKDIQEKFEK